MSAILDVQKELRKHKNNEKKKIMQSFFKTGPGQYGQGDIFLGLTVPQQRAIAKKYTSLDFPEIKELLYSKIHEERLCAVLILVNQCKEEPKKVYEFYLTHAKQINNWDLVDLSAPHIVGQYLLERKKEREVLYHLAKSNNLWEKRISIVATHRFIKQKEFKDTIQICELLMKDTHDLIHKACGWMLREVGKNGGEKILCEFLEKHIKVIPRTTLRYAIERFPEQKRKEFLKK